MGDRFREKNKAYDLQKPKLESLMKALLLQKQMDKSADFTLQTFLLTLMVRKNHCHPTKDVEFPPDMISSNHIPSITWQPCQPLLT